VSSETITAKHRIGCESLSSPFLFCYECKYGESDEGCIEFRAAFNAEGVMG